jgi:phosphatidylglycerophosphate synthase
MKVDAVTHVRDQGSVLSRAEKRLLVWIAIRLPPWVSPDHLTALGGLSMLLAGLAFWAARYDRRALAAVIPCLVLNWLGDSLDGTLARVRNRLRPRYGYYVDHAVDLLGALFLLGGLALSGYMSPTVALLDLAALFLLMAEVFLATMSLGTFRMSFLRVGPTELRILLAVGVLRLLDRSEVTLAGERYLLFDVGGLVAAVAILTSVLVAAARNAVALYRAERLP